MMTFLVVLTTVLVGLLVGVELSVATFVNPIFDRLPDAAALAARSDGARTLGRTMPFAYIASVLLAVAVTIATWGGADAVAPLVAALLLVASVLMSVLWLVPINDRVKQWSSGDAPADWKQQVHAWDRLHYARVLVIIVAFALLAYAATC